MLRSDAPYGGATSERVQVRNRIRAHVAAFHRQEDGSLLIFGLFCFVMMLLVAGVALDVMRFEERRTTLQNTTDRAVLAAADLRQTLPPKDVVKDYFTKAGLTPPTDSQIIVNQGNFNEWRTVQANTSEVMPTWFMNAFGFKTLKPASSSTAEQRIGDVEISLVLDVSGSMNSNNRLVNLRPAAKAFIDQMFDSVQAGRLSMSIVSYSQQASIGQDVIKYFAIESNPPQGDPTVTSCLNFSAADFNTTAMSPKSTPPGQPALSTDKKYKLDGVFDPLYTSWMNLYSMSNTFSHCPADTVTSTGHNKDGNRDAIVFSGNRAALKDKVDKLVASGNTSIDIGMKWGAALLDPSLNPVVTRMIGAGKVNAGFANRPEAYKKPDGSWNSDVLKVIVVMTDGENTTEWKLRDGYKGASISPLVKDTSNTYAVNDIRKYSLWDASRGQYYRFRDSGWYRTPTGTPANMSWGEVWSVMSVNYFSTNVIGPVYGYNETANWNAGYSTARATTYINTTKNAQTLAICSAAKANNVKIFTIGFEAPVNGQTLLKSCATSPANFYPTAGPAITTAFASIASSINKLRLTH